MHTITYVSTACQRFSAEALEHLLEKSRDRNAEHGITGMLLYKGGNFIQTIEGPEPAIAQLYRNIQADPTHHSVTTLLDEAILERAFPDWSMGFADLNAGNPAEIPGYTDFLRNPAAINDFMISPSQAKQLISVFTQSLR